MNEMLHGCEIDTIVLNLENSKIKDMFITDNIIYV